MITFAQDNDHDHISQNRLILKDKFDFCYVVTEIKPFNLLDIFSVHQKYHQSHDPHQLSFDEMLYLMREINKGIMQFRNLFIGDYISLY